MLGGGGSYSVTFGADDMDMLVEGRGRVEVTEGAALDDDAVPGVRWYH